MAKGGTGTIDGATVGEGDWGGRYVDPQFEGQGWYDARAGMDKSPEARTGILGAIMGSGQRGPGRLPGGYLNLRDYFNGGGPGMAGTRFEGSPFAGLLNAIGVHPRGYAARQQTIADKLAMRDAPMMAGAPMVYANTAGGAAAPVQQTAQTTGGNIAQRSNMIPLSAQEVAALRSAGFPDARVGMPPTDEMFRALSGLPLPVEMAPVARYDAMNAPLSYTQQPMTGANIDPQAYANNYLARSGQLPFEDAVGIPYYDPMAVPGQVTPQYSGVGMGTGQYAHQQMLIPPSNADFARQRAFRMQQYVQDQFPYSYQQTPYQTPYVAPGYQLPVSP